MILTSCRTRAPGAVFFWSPAFRKIRRLLHGTWRPADERFWVLAKDPFILTGHIVYETAGDLWAMPFSVSDLKRTGQPFPIQRGASLPSIAADGTLVYLGTTGGLEQLFWRDRKGAKLGAVGQPQRRIRAPRLSPDGSHIAAHGWEDAPQSDIWILDVRRGSTTRLTSHPAREQRAVWTRQSDMITFTSERDGSADIFIQSADGSGEPTVLVATQHNEFESDWSDDGKYLIHSRCAQGQCDLWT